MYELWIEDGGSEHHRQQLAVGSFRLGRLADNEIHIPDTNISRHHLRLDVSAGQVLVTDLGSTNGTQLNGRALTPHQATPWPPEESLRIGPLKVHLRRAETAVAPPPPAAVSQVAAGPLVASVVCREGIPAVYQLAAGAMVVGSDASCAMRLVAGAVAPHHCQIMLVNNQLHVSNMAAANPARLAGQPLPVGVSQPWPAGQPLQIGGATLYASLVPAGAVPRPSWPTTPFRQRGRLWRYLMSAMLVAAVSFVCLSGLAVALAREGGCDGVDIRCLLASLGASSPGGGTPGAEGPATPTLAPQRTAGPTATTANVIVLTDETPPPMADLACETIVAAASDAGWLDLPLPYDGTAEQFRRVSQRSRFGGRINSFFDHEYPLYPPSVRGLEPLDPITTTQTLVIFDGSRSTDAFQDASGGDWYSGHAGIDFSPENAFREDTAVLAAAEGVLYVARIDGDGNHMVWIEHDPDGDGRNRYVTLYFHLKPDAFFEQRVAQFRAMEEGAPPVTIAAGERIGTMGTTGRSSGIHLHFEVRYDADNNRRYTAFERLDPYGFFPSQEIPADPWSLPLSWVDSQGRDQESAGVTSQYLWKHPLVDVQEEEDVCVEQVNVQVDLYPILGWTVVDPGFTHINRNAQGDVVDVGPPSNRVMTILPDDLVAVDLDTLSLEFLRPGGDPQRDWTTVPRSQTELIERPTGGYTFRAQISRTGRYVLVGQQTEDLVAPIVVINLSGDQGSQPDSFRESVRVSLIGSDSGYPAPSRVREIQYSLDCGATWRTYEQPFMVSQETPHSCGESGAGEQGQFDANQFLLLAIATDFNDNVQQPASQVIFTLE